MDKKISARGSVGCPGGVERGKCNRPLSTDDCYCQASEEERTSTEPRTAAPYRADHSNQALHQTYVTREIRESRSSCFEKKSPDQKKTPQFALRSHEGSRDPTSR